jgi:predicted RNase H-like nuclease
MNVTVTVSQPATKIAGGWTGLRPVGRVRTYRANVAGVDYTNTSKTEIQRVIRAAVYRAETAAGFLHTPVSFTFVSEASA